MMIEKQLLLNGYGFIMNYFQIEYSRDSIFFQNRWISLVLHFVFYRLYACLFLEVNCDCCDEEPHLKIGDEWIQSFSELCSHTPIRSKFFEFARKWSIVPNSSSIWNVFKSQNLSLHNKKPPVGLPHKNHKNPKNEEKSSESFWFGKLLKQFLLFLFL